MSDIPTSCFCTGMRKATRRLSNFYDETLAPAGVNVAQFAVLRYLRQYGSMSLTALGKRLELERSTLGRNLRVLERMGLVDLKPGADQREAVAGLTASGLKTLSIGDPLWESAQADVAKRIGAAGVAQLQALLSAL